MRCRKADEEDVVLSAFDSFCRRAEQGRFPDLHDRDNLWRLLLEITECKACKLARDEGRLKRGAGKVRGDFVLLSPGGSAAAAGFDRFAGREPTPSFAVEVAEEFRRLLDQLEDATLQSIALWKMEGLTNEEIAARLDCAVKTVERKLKVIRKLWEASAS
jgi:DNA-directed RNA polymerase specialized sigma24 family protein